MSHKRKFTSPGTTQVKTRRKSFSNEEKLDVINRLAKGERIANIRRDVGVDKNKAQRIRDNADKTEEVLKSVTKMSAVRICYSESSTTEHMYKKKNTECIHRGLKPTPRLFYFIVLSVTQ
jgi:hypothetical protein